MFVFLYNIALYIIQVFLPFALRKNEKYQTRVIGLKDTFSTLENFRSTFTGKKIFWFHAASSGEFEQAKPIIEYLKKNHNSIAIFVTFFSSSGYKAHSEYAYLDGVAYLPIDTPGKSKKFLEILAPHCAVFVRYDLWMNLIKRLNKNNVPVYCICATASSNAQKNSLYKLYLKKVYELCTEIFCVNKDEYDKIVGIAPNANTTLSSDTRFDRIISIVEKEKSISLSRNDFDSKKPILVAGSTWREDEQILFQYYLKYKNNLPTSLIIVPHEPSSHNVRRLKGIFEEAILLSDIEKTTSSARKGTYSIVIVDSVGKLLSLYSLGDAAYVGGGFGAGIHSTSEPAGYGIPLCGGPKIERSPDALLLSKEGALTQIVNTKEFCTWINSIVLNKENRLQKGFLAKNYIYSRKGATKQIVDELEHLL